MHRETPLERRMTRLLSQLQDLVSGPTFSFRLAEIQQVAAELTACWHSHQQRSHAPPLRADVEDSPRPLGLPTTRHCVSCPYTIWEIQALFHTARQEDVELGGRYDAHSTAINLWSSPWPSTWIDPYTRESTLQGTWYFQWGEGPGLWRIDVDDGSTLADLLQELGCLELKALGYLKHGQRPT
jgi:hypothetical protein